jgi:hypothetical protein
MNSAEKCAMQRQIILCIIAHRRDESKTLAWGCGVI